MYCVHFHCFIAPDIYRAAGISKAAPVNKIESAGCSFTGGGAAVGNDTALRR